MKCRVCGGGAVIDIPRANANFCPDHFVRFCRDQVVRAIHDHDMIPDGARVLVAVSGGKDSLAVWDLLLDLGYHAEGFYLGLGIGSYSDVSAQHARRFAERVGATLHEVDLPGEFGYDIPTGSRAARRVPCSACGLSKRHLFDKAAIDGGFDVLVTGHNLDDEAAVLLGNVLHWHTEYLGRQRPVLEAGEGFPRKVKPLIRLGEREMAAYCLVRGIDYLVDECPLAAGNRHIGYKEALARIEAGSPGAKLDFYHRFLTQAGPRFADTESDEEPPGSPTGASRRCSRCGSPTTTEVCAFCRLVERATDPVAVELARRPSKRRRRAARTAAEPTT